MFVWIEYFCSKCQATHRFRMDVELETAGSISSQIKRPVYTELCYADHKIVIDDIAVNEKKSNSKKQTKRQGGSKIYVDPETPIFQIVRAVGNYMKEYYTATANTLKVEVCSQ